MIPDEIVQGELVIAALIMRTHNGREVILSLNELAEAHRALREGELEMVKDEVGNTTIKITEPTLRGEIVDEPGSRLQKRW